MRRRRSGFVLAAAVIAGAVAAGPAPGAGADTGRFYYLDAHRSVQEIRNPDPGPCYRTSSTASGAENETDFVAVVYESEGCEGSSQVVHQKERRYGLTFDSVRFGS